MEFIIQKLLILSGIVSNRLFPDSLNVELESEAMDAKGYKKIDRCRISGSSHLVPVLDLGFQELTGVFPKSKSQNITRGPLELVWCPDSGLLQLGHSYDAEEMYGENYGYRSGLNQTMVNHLKTKIQSLEKQYKLLPGDVVLDIGSNDATSLKAYTTTGLTRVGIDPTGYKFKEYYTDGIILIPDFFGADVYKKAVAKKVKIITSIAMFYDLESPIEFTKQIEEILDDEGVWHFEQSYMPSMLRLSSYDTICHEHLEYYSLASVKYILDRADMIVVDVAMNAVNGGSFAVTAAKKRSGIKQNSTVINWILEQEERIGLGTPSPYRDFEARVYSHRSDLNRLIKGLVSDGKKILGYGASTKGNVVLQFCGLTENDITAMAEVNPDKFGSFTPGSNIPIICESEARSMKPDYYLMLPWHFKEGILNREKEYIASGGKFIVPFPEIQIV